MGVPVELQGAVCGGGGSSVGLLLLCGFAGGKELPAVGDEAFLFGLWQGEDSLGPGGKFGEGESVRGFESLLPFVIAQNVPALSGNPVNAGEVRGGDDAFLLAEISEALRTGGKGGDVRLSRLKAQHEEGLAADGFVAAPVEEASPLLDLDDVG